MTKKRLGVIDIGNLKVKLEVVEIGAGQTTSLYNSNTLTCLGLRMNENNNRPLEENLQATLIELKRCQKILNDQKVDKIRVVSTHALREMGEAGKKIQEKIKQEVGLKIEIISQEEEAELFYRAVTHTWPNDEALAIAAAVSGE